VVEEEAEEEEAAAAEAMMEAATVSMTENGQPWALPWIDSGAGRTPAACIKYVVARETPRISAT
jgi:hypothetical protein